MKQKKRWKGILWGFVLTGVSAWSLKTVANAEEIEEQISMEMKGSEGVLVLDAHVKEDLQGWKEGIASVQEIPVEVLKSLYGEVSKWEKNEQNEFEVWEYQKEHVSAFSENGWISFEDQRGLKTGEYPFDSVYECKNDEEVLERAETVLRELELPIAAAGVLQNLYEEGETDYAAVRLQGVLDGKKIAVLTIGNPEARSNQGILEFYKGNVIQLEFARTYQAEEAREVELLPLKEILEKLRLLVENEWIYLEKEVIVKQITLQYFLEWEGDEVTFRPIWNFQADASEEKIGFPTGRDDFFYIDGQTGEFVQYREEIGFDLRREE